MSGAALKGGSYHHTLLARSLEVHKASLGVVGISIYLEGCFLWVTSYSKHSLE